MPIAAVGGVIGDPLGGPTGVPSSVRPQILQDGTWGIPPHAASVVVEERPAPDAPIDGFVWIGTGQQIHDHINQAVEKYRERIKDLRGKSVVYESHMFGAGAIDNYLNSIDRLLSYLRWIVPGATYRLRVEDMELLGMVQKR